MVIHNQSKFLTSAGDIAGWFWHQQTSPEETTVNFLDDEPGSYGHGIGAALDGLGLPNKQSNNPDDGIQVIYVAHADYALSSLPQSDPGHVSINDQTYKAGATYRATGGFYKFGINTSTGALFGLDRLAPEKAADHRVPQIEKDELPSLQRYSDVAWLFWAKQAARKNKLKYFFTVAITNIETQRAIRRALKNAQAEYGPWPGTTFSVDSDEGKVLLGCSNGRGHGYFLAQHKPQLGGNMYISKIQVFHGNTEPLIPNMVHGPSDSRLAPTLTSSQVLHVEQPAPASKMPQEKSQQKKRKHGHRKKSAKL
ncbi:hypothetical protein EJ07DRAFT_126217 [Lizonia empirigonia]|nr:hypothetical protein EJ07DRAFT_126217 [Lizonia empirigonia]